MAISAKNYCFKCILRRFTAILLEQKNFGPNVIYYVFCESGGPSADDVGLEVGLKSTTQVNLKSTCGIYQNF